MLRGISRSIGEGAFGVVYRGYYRKTGTTTDMRVAIKVSIRYMS
jgi:serine/threonine protein kinase